MAKERENVELMEVSSGIKRMLVIAAVAVKVQESSARSPRLTTFTDIVDNTVLLASWQV